VLARRFALLVLLPSLILVACAVFVGYFKIASDLEKRVDKELLMEASALDDLIHRRLDMIKADLVVMETFHELGEYLRLTDLRSFTEADERLVALEERYIDVAKLKPDCKSFRYFDPNGISLINVIDQRRSYDRLDVSKELWFRLTLASRGEDPTISPVHRETPAADAMITVAWPVRDTDRLRAVLAVDIEVAKLVGVLVSGPDGYVYLVDQQARVVASGGEGGPTVDVSPSQELAAQRVSAGFESVISAPNRNGAGMRVAYTPSQAIDVGIVLAAPYDLVFAPVRSVRNILVPSVLAGFALAAGLALWLVSRITKPVRQVSAGAVRIAEGQLDLVLGGDTRDEIGELANSFNRMTRSLLAAREGEESKNRELQAAVAAEQKRAAELQTAYESIKDTQRRLAQAEKLSLLGQLAGGIAHDFNNLLGGILGCADLLRKQVGTPTERERYAEMILETGHRAAELVRQLLAFARPAPTNRAPIDMHGVINEVMRILEHTIDPRITLRKRFAAGSTTVEGDAAELQSALLNLGVNARDAMPEGGALTFTTSDLVLDAETCERYANTVEPGRYLEIGVSDDGCGMAREVLDHIFEPFFTTKDVGSGTGLGLAAVYGTVHGHGGMITVYSEPDEGSHFKLLLPLSDDVAVAPGAPSPKLMRGSGRILVVDDEAVIRSVARDMLQSVGYDVVTANDGEQALDLYRNEAGTIDLVVLDLVMPGMNGNEVLRELKRIDPGARVLIASGFQLDVDMPEIRREGASGFLAKPFVIANLSQAVAAAMDGAPQAVGSMRILLAEDSLVNREVVCAQLAQLGHTCVAVEDGAAAVERSAAEQFDLVLMDMHMPVMDGCEAAGSIRDREQDRGGRLPIVALTGTGSEEDREACREAGMEGFLLKPVGLDALGAEIERVTKSSGLPRRGDAKSRLQYRIACAFLEESPRLMHELDDALAEGDARALHRAAHTLYGSFSHFDAASACELADRLQQMGRAGALDDAARLAGRLHEEYEQLTRDLRSSQGGLA